MLARLDTTDIHRAKDVLKGHICIQGNVPSTLLQAGSAQDVRDYCKKLIDTVGKNLISQGTRALAEEIEAECRVDETKQ